MGISNKLILPILGVVGLIILGYFLTQMFGSFGQLNYQTMAHCTYQGERFLSLVNYTGSATADVAWNNPGRSTLTLVPDSSGTGTCNLGAGITADGSSTALTYYTPNGRTFTISTDIAAAGEVPGTRSFQPLAIMTANGGILSLLIQALPLLAALGVLTAGYMWYKGGFGPAKMSG